jgi:hypothetical protein
MKNLLSFSKGSMASQDETHMLEKIRALVERYATEDVAQMLVVLIAYTKINGPSRKLSKMLDMAPTDYAKDLAAATLRLREDQDFNRMFHFIRATCEEVEAEIPRFPAALPYTP